MSYDNNGSGKSYLEIFNEYMNEVSKENDSLEKSSPKNISNDISDNYRVSSIKYSFERENPTKNTAARKYPQNKNQSRTVRRKGLKWTLKRHMNLKTAAAALLTLIVIIIIISVASAIGGGKAEEVSAVPETTAAPVTEATSYQIPNIKVISQDTLLAGCETYACTMLLQYLNYDIDEFQFADNYLITYPMTWDENGTRYGPDMNSAFAGDIYTGFGINAPAMAKSMNKYLVTTNKNQKAYDISGTNLETLCEEYVKNNIPVMVWATARMDEPYIDRTWVVDYVDENAKAKIGDTVGWYEHEHCLLLVGFDENNYYFCDSLEGKIMGYERKITETRYSQLGAQSIVVK